MASRNRPFLAGIVADSIRQTFATAGLCVDNILMVACLLLEIANLEKVQLSCLVDMADHCLAE